MTTLQYTFSTNSLSFLELLLKKEDGEITEITSLLADYTPSQIIVSAPIRYLDTMKVIHRQPGMKGADTNSVTNIDIEVDDEAVSNPNGDVAAIEVLVYDEVDTKI